MKVEINVTEAFKRAARPLIKKFPSFLDDLVKLEAELSANPRIGSPLGNNTYKVRLRIRSKGKGKSGGGRVITLVQLDEQRLGGAHRNVVNLITVYDKSERADIRDSELKRLIETLKA